MDKQFKQGKWQLEFSNQKRIEYMDGRRSFIFGIYKVTSIPPLGVLLNKNDYSGFRLIFTYFIKRGW